MANIGSNAKREEANMFHTLIPRSGKARRLILLSRALLLTALAAGHASELALASVSAPEYRGHRSGKPKTVWKQ